MPGFRAPTNAQARKAQRATGTLTRQQSVHSGKVGPRSRCRAFLRRGACGFTLPAGEPKTVDFTLETMLSEEITVTATKREQTLLDVPFSVAAVPEEMLRERGVDDIEERRGERRRVHRAEPRAQARARWRCAACRPARSCAISPGSRNRSASTSTSRWSRCRSSRPTSISSTPIASRCCAVRRARCSAPARCREPCATSPTSRRWA